MSKIFVTVAFYCFVGFLFSANCADVQISNVKDIDEVVNALNSARKERQLVWVIIHSDSCPYSANLMRDLGSGALDISGESNRILIVEHRNKKLVDDIHKMFPVFNRKELILPTTIFANPALQKANSIPGYSDPEKTGPHFQAAINGVYKKD